MSKQAYFKSVSSDFVLATDRPELWSCDSHYIRISATEGARLKDAEARAQLLKLLKPGATVYTILRHVSGSGMYRRISLYAISKDRAPVCLDGYALNLGIGQRPRDGEAGIGVSGCGMDMGFDLVYRLGARLWPKGTKKPHGTRNGKPDSDGGYALKQSWL